MLDEGIYLFFDNEISAQGDCSLPFGVINFSKKLLRDITTEFTGSEADPIENEGQDGELKPLSERKFDEHCRKTQTVLFVCIKSLTDLEFALVESDQLVDWFRSTISNKGFLFGVEVWDASFFWTAASIRRWFKTRFPLELKRTRYAKPPSVLDLLYEFLESVSHSQENLFTLKETLLVLPEKDRLFVEDILGGKNPNNSKESQETSARILRALMGRKGG